jgi:DNA-binding transcriptional ArsR family regulator
MRSAPQGLANADLAARVTEVAELLKLLGNPQRLMIACLLAEGESAVSDIEARLGIRQPSLSQQLGALREAGVIQGRREAKAVIYRLADDRVPPLLLALQRIFCPEGVDAAAAAMAPALHTPPAAKPSSFAQAGAASFARLRPASDRSAA